MWIFAGDLADAVAALPQSGAISIETFSGLIGRNSFDRILSPPETGVGDAIS
jgi:hypothetical protein